MMFFYSNTFFDWIIIILRCCCCNIFCTPGKQQNNYAENYKKSFHPVSSYFQSIYRCRVSDCIIYEFGSSNRLIPPTLRRHRDWFLLTLGRCGHRPLRIVRFLHIIVGCDAHIAPRESDEYCFRRRKASCLPCRGGDFGGLRLSRMG